jgi:hypothetical protein
MYLTTPPLTRVSTQIRRNVEAVSDHPPVPYEVSVHAKNGITFSMLRDVLEEKLKQIPILDLRHPAQERSENFVGDARVDASGPGLASFDAECGLGRILAGGGAVDLAGGVFVAVHVGLL